jgi:uncharacterized damage-inducible protein DinB
MDNDFYGEFISQSIIRIDENTAKVKSCMKELDDHEVWFYPNAHVNSVGNTILHLCGNIRQYVISSIGGQHDIRERDLEFSTKGGFTNAELVIKLSDTIEEAKSFIACVSHENLHRHRIVQKTSYSGIGIIIHITEHYSYHTGQIILLTKLFKDMDMGFYAGKNLNDRNVPSTN